MRRVWFPLVMLLALLLVACGGKEDSKATTSSVSGPWMALLDVIPDTSDMRKYVEMNDYAALRALNNLQAPTDIAALDEYRRKLLVPANGASPSHISGLGQYYEPATWLKQLGFHPGQVDADIRAGSPPNNVEALRGRFDVKNIETVIDTDTSPVRKLLTKASREGATLYIWGEDNAQDLQNRSALRPLGRGERLAVKGDLLFWTHATPPLNDMADSGAGKKPSLADAADVQALLAGVTKFSPYALIISDQAMTPDALDVVGANPSTVREARDASFKEALKPYSLFAIAYGQDAQGPFSAVALLHTSDALAKENVAKLKSKIDTGRSSQNQTQWKDLITSSEFASDGKLLTAKLRTTKRTLLTDVVQRRDNLLVHE